MMLGKTVSTRTASRGEPEEHPDFIGKMKFTISVSPSLSRGNMKLLTSRASLERLSKNRNRIQEINFTCHIPPFSRDAHGVYLSPAENMLHLRDMIQVQKKTGIPVSPVFNDIHTPNHEQNLALFIKHFQPLYDLGIRSVSIPHVLWLKMGTFQTRFPDVKIKNTVLRRVRSGQELWNHAEAGYDYINLDRVIVRDRRALREVHAAQQMFLKQTGKRVLTSILHGEGCLGNCPLWEEHYQHTLTHPQADENPLKNLEIFRYPQHFSCLSFTDHIILPLISAGLPHFREDLNAVCQYVDVIKLGGRRAFQSLNDNLSLIEAFFDSKDDVLFDPPEILTYFAANPSRYEKLLKTWRRRTQNCRFQCWGCRTCSELIARYAAESNIP